MHRPVREPRPSGASRGSGRLARWDSGAAALLLGVRTRGATVALAATGGVSLVGGAVYGTVS